MSCAAQNFEKVTPAVWQCCKAAVAKFGITITADSGTENRDGLTVTWKYVPGAQTLMIQCLDKPFFVGCGTINSRIHDMVEACLNL